MQMATVLVITLTRTMMVTGLMISSMPSHSIALSTRTWMAMVSVIIQTQI